MLMVIGKCYSANGFCNLEEEEDDWDDNEEVKVRECCAHATFPSIRQSNQNKGEW